MSLPHEPMIVAIIVVVASATVIAGVSIAGSHSASTSPLLGCSGETPIVTPAVSISAGQPVLMPACSEFFGMYLTFNITGTAELMGSWQASAPAEFGLFNQSALQTTSYGWPDYCPGCFNVSGSFNVVLFPGSYEIEFAVLNPTYAQGFAFATTHAFIGVFDRTLNVIGGAGQTTIPANGYTSWPTRLTENYSGAQLEASFATTACNFVLAILPATVLEDFEVDRGAISSPGVVSIESESASICSVNESLTQIGPDQALLSAVPAGSALVFWNASNCTAKLDSSGPIEISYPTPA